MPAPKVHFRFEMGELYGRNSYIMQSKNGIMWLNVPDDLEAILNRVVTRNILDFSLGCSGRYYIKWKEGDKIKRKLSKGLWQEIGQDPNDTLERLSLGADGQYWGVSSDSSQIWTFDNLEGSLGGQLLKLGDSYAEESFWFVALGTDDSYSYSARGNPSTRSRVSTLKSALQKAKLAGKTVMNVTLSPFTWSYYHILYTDGTYNYNLPSSWIDDISPYMQASFLMIPKPAPAKTPSVTPPTISRLRQLFAGDREFNQVWDLFFTGWKHPHKDTPDSLRIFAIDLPPSLLSPYEAYRSGIQQEIGSGRLNERKVFHGTPRACCMGDPGSMLRMCTLTSCNVCSIIRTSFQVSRAGTAPHRNFMRFGRGIYTTSVSSKADDYNVTQSNSDFKAMLVAKVVLGNGYPMFRTNKTLKSPPYQWDSVLGEIGEDLNYDEQVVYRDEAIRPAYLLIYEL